MNQTQQLVKILQDKNQRPNAILVAPVGTDMPQVARAAAAAGIGWGILNRAPAHVAKIRRSSNIPVFAITTDQEEVGRIQAKQLAALVKEGNVLYVQGPANSAATKLRAQEVIRNKPAAVELKTLRGDWTEHSAQRAVRTWLTLSTSRQLQIRAVICQNDVMAVGARKALTNLTEADHEKWMNVPFTGCDGLPGTGQEWVRRGMLRATVVIRPSAGLGLELFAKALRENSAPPAVTLIEPISYPPIAELAG